MKRSRKISPPAKATIGESPGGNLQNLKAKSKLVSTKQASERARKEATNTKLRMQPIHEAPAISKRSKSKSTSNNPYKNGQPQASNTTFG
tara:strand:- start:211 stop:480 length:270 start_codon:yes stop_codon:yes gene_type:complete